MKKSCPACGSLITDTTREFCPKCEKLQLSSAHLSKEELDLIAKQASERLAGDWKFKAKVAGSVITLVLLIIGIIDTIVGFNLKENMASHFQTLEIQATNRIAQRLADLDNDTKVALAQVDIQMRSNVARNFEAPAIQSVIESVSERESKRILEAQVQPAVESFREDALFIRTVARAQAYDFKAYQQLLVAKNETNKNAELAKQVVTEIGRALDKERSEFAPKRILITVSGTNTYSGPFTSDELAAMFSGCVQDPTALNREGFANAVIDLRQPLFLPSLVQWFTNETDLTIADKLACAISALAKENFKPNDYFQILAWWDGYRDTVTNWPFTALNLGCKEFMSTRYPQAAQAFEQVLKLDPGADMSRAYAIACYCETGETNRASSLAKSFATSSGRWAKWASAKADLDAGNISNATVSFFTISTNFPDMSPLPNPNYHVFRKIDWQLFNRLKGSNSPQK